MFSFISMNWKGEPLVSFETVVNLISATTHATRAARESRVRQTLVRDRGQNQRRADERPEHPTPQPKPRVELFDLSSRQLKELNGKLYFAAIPKRRIEHEVGHAQDSVHRRPDFVAHVGEELA